MHPLTFMIGDTPLNLDVTTQLIPEADRVPWTASRVSQGV